MGPSSDTSYHDQTLTTTPNATTVSDRVTLFSKTWQNPRLCLADLLVFFNSTVYYGVARQLDSMPKSKGSDNFSQQ